MRLPLPPRPIQQFDTPRPFQIFDKFYYYLLRLILTPTGNDIWHTSSPPLLCTVVFNSTLECFLASTMD